MEVAEEIGISQAQVSRLEKNAIEHIKRIYRVNYITNLIRLRRHCCKFVLGLQGILARVFYRWDSS